MFFLKKTVRHVRQVRHVKYVRHVILLKQLRHNKIVKRVRHLRNVNNKTNCFGLSYKILWQAKNKLQLQFEYVFKKTI